MENHSRWQTIFEALQFIVAVIAVIFAYKIGKKQNDISKQIVELGDVVELYGQLITNPDLSCPRIAIYNTGTKIFFIDRYIFNGKEFLLNGEARPPCSANIPNNYYFIELPTDNTTHVSLEVYFKDNESRNWKTKIFAEKKDYVPWLIKTLKSERVFL